MKKIYQIGVDNDISVGVDKVSTVGVVFTRILLKDNNGRVTEIARSPNVASGGVVPLTMVGNSNQLGNSSLFVTVTVNLGLEPKDQWAALRKNLFIKYQLTGGVIPAVPFEYDTNKMQVASSGQYLLVTEVIQLKQ